MGNTMTLEGTNPLIVESICDVIKGSIVLGESPMNEKPDDVITSDDVIIKQSGDVIIVTCDEVAVKETDDVTINTPDDVTIKTPDDVTNKTPDDVTINTPDVTMNGIDSVADKVCSSDAQPIIFDEDVDIRMMVHTGGVAGGGAVGDECGGFVDEIISVATKSVKEEIAQTCDL
uniref:Uncharacterized protein n=2 Tax=Ciona intestinalis TaxID=7719 RepID=H2XTF5_CIOIN